MGDEPGPAVRGLRGTAQPRCPAVPFHVSCSGLTDCRRTGERGWRRTRSSSTGAGRRLGSSRDPPVAPRGPGSGRGSGGSVAPAGARGERRTAHARRPRVRGRTGPKPCGPATAAPTRRSSFSARATGLATSAAPCAGPPSSCRTRACGRSERLNQRIPRRLAVANLAAATRPRRRSARPRTCPRPRTSGGRGRLPRGRRPGWAEDRGEAQYAVEQASRGARLRVRLREDFEAPHVQGRPAEPDEDLDSEHRGEVPCDREEQERDRRPGQARDD